MNNRLESIIDNFGVLPEDVDKVMSALIRQTKYGTLEEKNQNIIDYMSSYLEMQELKKENQELNELATVDPLTKLYNRGKFNNDVEAFFCRNPSLSLLMIDIDHFKNVNDTYGHQHGDKVLMEVSNILKETIRGTDGAYRYGGEEMAALLPDTDIKTTYGIAERIRKEIENTSYKTETGDSMNVTASIGIANTEQLPYFNTVDEFIQHADSCLYVAKDTGRNRVVLQ